MIKQARHLTLLAAALGLAGVALTACGPMEPGAAAVVGGTRITEEQVAADVAQILQAQDRPADTADADLTSTTVSRLVTMELVRQAAAQAGITITQGDIDTMLAAYLQQAGSQEKLDQIFIGQNIAPSQITDIVVLNLRAQALGQALLPDGDAQAQGAEVFAQIGAFSTEIGTTVSPRYGSWDPANLDIGPVLDPLAVAPAAG